MIPAVGFGWTQRCFPRQCLGSNEGNRMIWGPLPAAYSRRHPLLRMNLGLSLWTRIVSAPWPLGQRKDSGCFIYWDRKRNMGNNRKEYIWLIWKLFIEQNVLCCASCVLVEQWIVLHMPWFIYLRAEFLPSGVRLESVSIGLLLWSIWRGSGVHGALVAVLVTVESAVDNANALGKNNFMFPLLLIRISEWNFNLSTESH